MFVVVLLLAAVTAAAPGGSGGTLAELREAELERYALLMLDPAASGVADIVPAGAVTRRITPKSVFIAPSINGDQCAEGYQQDEMGRCVKVVKVDAEKSWDLLLDRLNNQFAGDINDPVADATGPPPGPPPGPLQVAIPIADQEVFAVPSSSTKDPPLAEIITDSDASEDNMEVTTSPPVEETTTTRPSIMESSVSGEQSPPAEAGDSDPQDEDMIGDPEVVMLSSEEQQPLVPLASGTVMETVLPAISVASDTPTSNLVSSDNSSAIVKDNSDNNVIINTVNASPLVTGKLSNLLPAAVVVPDTTPFPATDSSVSVTVSSSSSSVADEDPAAFSASRPVPVTSVAISSTAASTTASTPTTSSTPTPQHTSTASIADLASSPVSSTSSTPIGSFDASVWVESSSSTAGDSLSPSQSNNSTEEVVRRGSISNRLRPPTSRIPVIAPEVRFPTEKPTLFRTASGVVRFPTIDVTFPTANGASRPDTNWFREKPVKFPKDEHLDPWRLPPPPSPASNWSLEQTRNKPYRFRYWSRSPSRLSPASFSDSLGLFSDESSRGSSSSSMGSASVENGSGHVPSSVWPPRNPPARQHSGNSFEFRRSSSSYNPQPHPYLHLAQSHRRGRDW